VAGFIEDIIAPRRNQSRIETSSTRRLVCSAVPEIFIESPVDARLARLAFNGVSREAGLRILFPVTSEDEIARPKK